MAMKTAAQLLDELMGKNRNILPEEQVDVKAWRDSEVCKHFLCGFCPHDLFTNTKSDLGPCPKVHDEIIKKEYEQSDDFGKMRYEDDFLAYLQQTMSDVDRRIRRGHSRLALSNSQQNTLSVPNRSKDEEKIKMLSNRINDLLEQVEVLGCDGLVEEAQGVMKLCDQLKAERDELKQATEQAMDAILSQEKQMEVCEVCGAFLIVGDAQSRVDDHLMGKQHMGYAKIKATIEEIKKKKNAPFEEREKQRAKEREEREKKLEEEREERKKRRDEREKEREKEREERRKKREEEREKEKDKDKDKDGKERDRDRDRDRRRSRSRSRDRRRSRSRDKKRSRSRDRSRRHRSRSRDRKRRSRSRDRRRRSRSRSRDRRRRSRSRDRRRRSRSRSRSRRSRSRDRRRSRDRDRKSSRDKDRRSEEKEGEHAKETEEKKEDGKEEPMKTDEVTGETGERKEEGAADQDQTTPAAEEAAEAMDTYKGPSEGSDEKPPPAEDEKPAEADKPAEGSVEQSAAEPPKSEGDTHSEN